MQITRKMNEKALPNKTQKRRDELNKPGKNHCWRKFKLKPKLTEEQNYENYKMETIDYHQENDRKNHRPILHAFRKRFKDTN